MLRVHDQKGNRNSKVMSVKTYSIAGVLYIEHNNNNYSLYLICFKNVLPHISKLTGLSLEIRRYYT